MDLKTMGVWVGGMAAVAGLAFVARRSESLSEEQEGKCPACGSTGECSCNVLDIRKAIEARKAKPLSPFTGETSIYDASEVFGEQRRAREELLKRQVMAASNEDLSNDMRKYIDVFDQVARAMELKYHDAIEPELKSLQAYRQDMAALSKMARNISGRIPPLQGAYRGRWYLASNPELDGDKETSLDEAARMVADAHFIVQTLADDGFYKRRGIRMAPLLDEQGRNVDEILRDEAVQTAMTASKLADLAAHLHRGQPSSDGKFHVEVLDFDEAGRLREMEELRGLMLSRAEISRNTPVGGSPRK